MQSENPLPEMDEAGAEWADFKGGSYSSSLGVIVKFRLNKSGHSSSILKLKSSSSCFTALVTSILRYPGRRRSSCENLPAKSGKLL